MFRIRVTHNLTNLGPLKRRVEHKRLPGGHEKSNQKGSFRIVTYNIHKCRGLDGRVRPERIAGVLREIDADIIALQEVWSVESQRPKDDQVSFIARELGLDYRFGENRRLNGGGYGNLILTRLPILSMENYDLSHRGREERGCLRTDLRLEGDLVLHVYNVHLGTAFLERRYQGRRLVEAEILTAEDVTGPRILLGDFNEWKRGLATRLLSSHFRSVEANDHLHRRRTYPAPLPLFHLDHMYFDGCLELATAGLHRSRKAIIASDHLPLVADFHLPDATARADLCDTSIEAQ